MITDFAVTTEWGQLASEATNLNYRIGCRPQSSMDDMLISMVKSFTKLFK
jgi:hypothetical protein